VLIGTCEPLDTPEALAPLFDIAADLGPDIQSRLAGEPRRAQLFAAVVACHQTSKGPWLLVLEDVHWADQATLDLLRYLGRRVDRLHGVIVATYRDDETTTTTPLAIVLGDLATSSGVHRLPLEPLSQAATGELAASAGIAPHELFERTAGNPFFITEVLASATERLPTSARGAVLARVARAPAVTRQTLEAAAALGRRFEAVEFCPGAAALSHRQGWRNSRGIDPAKVHDAFGVDSYRWCHPAPGRGSGILRAERASGLEDVASWAVVATGDKAAGTEVVRTMAQRAGATITEIEESHVIMISQPQAVVDVILSAVAHTTSQPAAAVYPYHRRTVGGTRRNPGRALRLPGGGSRLSGT
jgi:hypothetical protein